MAFESSYATINGAGVVHLSGCSYAEGGAVDALGLQFKMPSAVASGCSAANGCGWRPSATVVVYDGEYNLVTDVALS